MAKRRNLPSERFTSAEPFGAHWIGVPMNSLRVQTIMHNKPGYLKPRK